MTARLGTASGFQVSGFHSDDRRNAFEQWKKICSTSTSRITTGLWPLTTIWSAYGASARSCGPTVDAQRVTAPGHEEDQPDVRVLQDVGEPVGALVARTLGDRQRRVVDDEAEAGRDRPSGETSQRPVASEVATRQNGDAAIHARCSGENVARSLSSTRCMGSTEQLAELGFGRDGHVLQATPGATPFRRRCVGSHARPVLMRRGRGPTISRSSYYFWSPRVRHVRPLRRAPGHPRSRTRCRRGQDRAVRRRGRRGRPLPEGGGRGAARRRLPRARTCPRSTAEPGPTPSPPCSSSRRSRASACRAR